MSLPPPAEPASRAAFLGLNPWLQRFLTIIAGAVVAVIAWTVIARFLHILVLLLASFLVAFLPGPLVDRLGARGFLRRDGHRIPFYQYMGAATERTGNRRCRPPAAPTTDKRQAQFLTALIHQTQVVRGSWVWLHWCGVEELCQARGRGPAEVANLEATVIGPLEERALVRSYPAPGEMRFRPTYQGMRAAALPVGA